MKDYDAGETERKWLARWNEGGSGWVGCSKEGLESVGHFRIIDNYIWG